MPTKRTTTPSPSVDAQVRRLLHAALTPRSLREIDGPEYYDLIETCALQHGTSNNADHQRLWELEDRLKADPSDADAREECLTVKARIAKAEEDAAFAIGRHAGAILSGRVRPAVERFIDAIQSTAATQIDSHAMSPDGFRQRVELIRRAVPIARAVLLYDNVLAGPGTGDHLDAFITAEEQTARRGTPDATDPDDEGARMAAREDALYTVALLIGLMIGDTL